jgi:hypothetical protein
MIGKLHKLGNCCKTICYKQMNSILRQESQIGSLGEFEQVLESRASRSNVVDITPLSGMGFKGDSLLASSNNNTVHFGDYGRFRARGVISEASMVFGTYLKADTHSTLCNQSIEIGSIGYFPPGTDHSATYHSDVSIAMLMITPDTFEKYVLENGLGIDELDLKDPTIISSTSEMSVEIVRKFQSFKRHLEMNRDYLSNTIDFDLLVEDILQSFLPSLVGKKNSTASLNSNNIGDKDIVELVERIISSRPQDSHKIEEIARVETHSNPVTYERSDA